MKLLIQLMLISMLSAQTINDIKSDDLIFLTKFDFWYTSPVAGDSSRHHFEQFVNYNDRNNELALKHFKSAYSFAQKNDRYNLCNSSIELHFIDQLIKAKKVEQAEKRIELVTFLNNRNSYVKKFLYIIKFLKADIKSTKRDLLFASGLKETRNDIMKVSVSSNLISSSKFSKNQAVLISELHNFTDTYNEEPKTPFVLSLNFSYNFKLFETGLSFRYGNFENIPEDYGIYAATHTIVKMTGYNVFLKRSLFSKAGISPFFKLGYGFTEFNREKMFKEDILVEAKKMSTTQILLGSGFEFMLSGDANLFVSSYIDYFINSDEIFYAKDNYFYINIGIGYAFPE